MVSFIHPQLGLALEWGNFFTGSDITYVPMPVGFMYLVVIMDWFSRYVLAWELSNTLDVGFCLVALDRALVRRRPEFFNSNQGGQLPAKPSRADWSRPRCGSVWTGAGGPSITSSWSGSGAL